MKRFMLSALVQLITSFLFSQASEKGYYITWNDDTITTKFFIEGRSSFNFCLTADGIQIIDSNQRKVWLMPNEAKECRFIFKKKAYRIFSKPDNEYGRRIFLHAEVSGPRVSLFQCSTLPNVSVGRWSVTYFALEKTDGTLISTSTQEAESKLKEKLHRFFNSEPSMIRLVEEKFQKKEPLAKILKSLAQVYNGEQLK
jgi:hypothetical protein